MYFIFKTPPRTVLAHFTDKVTEAHREVSCPRQAARKSITGTWHPNSSTFSTHLLEVLLGDEATGISDVVLEGL